MDHSNIDPLAYVYPRGGIFTLCGVFLCEAYTYVGYFCLFYLTFLLFIFTLHLVCPTLFILVSYFYFLIRHIFGSLINLLVLWKKIKVLNKSSAI